MVMGVLGAVPAGISENECGVMGVLGAAPGPVLKNAHRADERLLDSLLTAAMRACDHHGDSEEARQQMHDDCMATPPHLRADLLAHFHGTYERKAQ